MEALHVKLDKKDLASRTLGVGKARIVFNKERLPEIKEAITKQDIRDLVQAGAIFVKPVDGRKTRVPRKRRRTGSLKIRVRDTKRVYMHFVRGARRHIEHAKSLGELSGEQATSLRKELKSRRIKTRAELMQRSREVKAA